MTTTVISPTSTEATPAAGPQAVVPPSEAAETDLTVIVPCYNGLSDLRHCLEALAANRGLRFDVLVVDDGSTQPIAAVVRDFGFRYVRIEGPRGPAQARNIGVQHVQAPVVVFIDADCCVKPDALQRFAGHFRARPQLGAVFGSYDDQPTAPGLVSQFRNLLHHYTHHRSAGEATTFWAGCGAVRRRVFLEVGGFDAARYVRPCIEDIELGGRIHDAGHTILLDPAIQCSHRKHWALRSMVKTDLFQRALPWLHLMRETRHRPAGLNVSPGQRASVTLLGLCLLFLPLGLVRRAFWIVALVAALGVLLINVPLYRYLAQRRGIGFALCCIPLHWIYFGTCGVSVPLAWLGWGRDRRPEAARSRGGPPGHATVDPDV
jgi:GT2 family glycosyltransferase